MATTVAPPTYAPAAGSTYGAGDKSVVWSWITTTDHKRIGLLYLFTALFFFLFGGLEAAAIRAQLAAPNQNLVSAELYNQLFTMHGTTMVFLAIMPLSAALIHSRFHSLRGEWWQPTFR